MTNFFTTTKIYLLSVFVCTFIFLVACQPDANKLEKTCFDEIQNQGETYIDCGGPCPVCQPRCNDCLRNGEETRPDCGGPDCPVCATCFDGIQNGHYINTSLNPTVDTIWTLVMEKGIDCGYPCVQFCPPSCINGIIDGNETGIDCDTVPGVCNLCVQSCEDGVRNGNEVGIDCDTIPGYCPDCGATCNDGIMNQDETGIDCGSVGCLVPCGTDFQPTPCPPATCWDGIMNGGETGIDCGGPCFNENGDSTILCPPPTQFDAIQNGEETGIDCGTGTVYSIIGLDTTEIPCPTCTDLVQNGMETGVDCGGDCIQACPTCCDGFFNGEELDIDCIWGNQPNPYNHPCLPCQNYVTATLTILGVPASFDARGSQVTVSFLSGVVTIKAVTEDGIILEIKYTGFVINPFVPPAQHNTLNALLGNGLPDPSYVKFIYPPITISNTWSTAAIPIDTDRGSLNFLNTSSLIPERYFRGKGENIKCLNNSPNRPPGFEGSDGVLVKVSGLNWGVFVP